MKLFTTEKCRKCLLFPLLLLSAIVSCNTDVKELTIRVRSRMYQGFQEDHRVKMYERFSISDTDLEGVVVEFIPDFAIDTLSHKAYSRSDTLYNPAAKVLIVGQGQKKEEAWAFSPGLMPHFSPRSFIGFELVSFKTGKKYSKPENGRQVDGKGDE